MRHNEHEQTGPNADKCPCGISYKLELVELDASGGYGFRGVLCEPHAAEMRRYWDERFHGSR